MNERHTAGACREVVADGRVVPQKGVPVAEAPVIMESKNGPTPMEPSHAKQFDGKPNKVMTVDRVGPKVSQHIFEIPFHRPMREINRVGIIVNRTQRHPVDRHTLVRVAAYGVPVGSGVRVSGEDGDVPTLILERSGLVMRNQLGSPDEIGRIRVRADENSPSRRLHGQSRLLGVLCTPHE
jgi:hypothetical protein